MVFQEKHLFKNINYTLKIKHLYEMPYIFGKPVLGHLCIKYFLKMIFSTIYFVCIIKILKKMFLLKHPVQLQD